MSLLKELSVSPPSLYPFLLACLGSAMIGSSGIFVRLSDFGPMTTGFYRMLFALPFLFIWMVWEKKEHALPSLLPLNHMVSLILAGAFFALDLAFWNWSIDQTTIVNSTLFNNTAVFFVPFILWMTRGEKQTPWFMLMTFVGFIGCMLLAGESLSISVTNLLGDCIALISGVMVALYLITLKKIREDITTGFLMWWTGLFSLFFLAIISYLFGESFWPFSAMDILSIFGQAILVHFIGQGLLAYSLGKIPASFTALILFLAPMTAAILGWLVFDESLSLLKILGMILIMVSVILVKKPAST
jgi:drug/metabolite transporter (DMT)-like permease